MTEIDYDELQRLCEHATPGQWMRSGVRQLSREYKGHMIGPDGNGVVIVPYDPKFHSECLANANLLALAPALAAECIRLRAELFEEKTR